MLLGGTVDARKVAHLKLLLGISRVSESFLAPTQRQEKKLEVTEKKQVIQEQHAGG